MLCIALGAARPWKPIPCSSLHTDRLCRQLATIAHCALQHALTPPCHFTWPTTLWLCCNCSQLVPLCYNTS
ncbi:unnamed protein product [Staurois parvus]|uniref:Uncharacterized protein n=1 Tax=Staurois parvus TaxID=386267 RepID=A0ABN9FPH3_9NEOB|nr:unnamed protein product [Staurois parvus]